MFRNVLVHLTGTECDRATLSAGLQIARLFAGHLTCLRAVPDPAAMIAQSAVVDMGGAMVLADTLDVIVQHAQERTKNARAIFDEFCRNHDIARKQTPEAGVKISAAWHESATGDEFDCIIAEARFHDAVVVAGGPERPGRLPEGALGSVIMGGGRPVLLAPVDAGIKPIRTVAIAWKNSPESARAM